MSLDLIMQADLIAMVDCSSGINVIFYLTLLLKSLDISIHNTAWLTTIKMTQYEKTTPRYPASAARWTQTGHYSPIILRRLFSAAVSKHMCVNSKHEGLPQRWDICWSSGVNPYSKPKSDVVKQTCWPPPLRSGYNRRVYSVFSC